MSSLFINKKESKNIKKTLSIIYSQKTFSDIVHIKKGFLMKKNILLVPSLLTLSFAVTTPLLGMENNQEQLVDTEQKKQEVTEQKTEKATVHFQNLFLEKLQTSPLFQNQVNRHNQKQETSHASEVIKNNVEIQTPQYLIQSETEVINVPTPEYMNNNNNNQIDLSQSFIMPTATRELVWAEWFSYHTSTAYQQLEDIITKLENNTFDTKHTNDFTQLETAIATASTKKDITSLNRIITACDNSQQRIKISQESAQQAATLLGLHYSTEVTMVNSTLEQQLQEKTKQGNLATIACLATITNATTEYLKQMQIMKQSYKTSLQEQEKHVEDLQKNLIALIKLNKTIAPTINELSINNQLKTPKNEVFSAILSAAEKKITDVQTSVNGIASIESFQAKPQYSTNLTNKCIINNK